MSKLSSLCLIALVTAACGKGGAAEKHAEHEEEGHDEHGEEGHEEEGHDEHGAEGLVELTPEQMVTAKIATATVEVRAVSAEIAATGEIVPPDNGIARVGPKMSGRVTKLAKGVGDPVRAGEVLAMLNSPELGRAKADYLVAATTARVTRENADREKALFDKGVGTERDWRNAEGEAAKARAEKEAAELRLHTFGISDAQLKKLSPDDHYGSSISVTSPIAGVVVERPLSVGQMAEPQDTMFVVMDLTKVWVQVDVYERDLQQVTVGQSVEARVQAWGERAFTGTIEVIGAVIDRRSRTIKVRVVLANPEGALKPGMFAAVKLGGTKAEPREGLFIPASAVQRDGDASVVFVPVGDHEFQMREVEFRTQTGDWFEVIHGLAPGEKVVSSGAFLLKSEAKRESFGGHEH